MPRKRARPDSAEDSRAPKAPAAPEGFNAWKRAASAPLEGVRGANRLRDGDWTKWYVQGLTVEQATDEARREAWNRLTTAERKLAGMKAG